MRPITAALLGLGLLSTPAFSLTFCNYSNFDADCAVVGYDPTSGFVTSGGWYHSTNGNCTGDVDLTPIKTAFGYYCFDSAGQWAGNLGNYCVDKSKAFTLYKADNATDCRVAGGTMVPFAPLGGSNQVTLNPR